MVAIPFYLVAYKGEEDGKFLNTIMMVVITTLTLFWGTYAGSLVDRYNRKRIFQVMNVVDGLLLTLIATYGLVTGSLPFPLIALTALTTIFMYNVHYPNTYAFVQELTEPRYYQRINAVIELQGQLTNFFGMIVGGVLLSGLPALSIAPWSLQKIILLDGGTYFISFLIISTIPYKPPKDRIVDKGAVWNRIYQGFKYLMSNRPLMIFGICSYVLFFTLIVLLQAIMPIYVNDYLGLAKAEGGLVYSSFKGVYSLGAFAAGLTGTIFTTWVQRTNLIKFIIFLMFIAGGLYISWGLSESAGWLVMGAFLMGIANAGIRILRITYLIRIVPNHMIGRVSAFFQVINVTMRLIMLLILLLPFFTGKENGANITYAMIIMGCAVLVSAIVIMIKFPKFEKSAAYG